MTARLALLALPALLAACANLPPATPPAPRPNPAAAFCIQAGGKVVPKETASGAEGWCQLPSGLLVDEWAFYNQAHPAHGSS